MLSQEMTLASTIAIDWTHNTDSSISIVINNDFVPTILSGADVASYASARGKHEMSRRTLFNVLKKGEIQDGDKSYEDEMADIEKDKQADMAHEVETASKLSEVEVKATKETNKADRDYAEEQNNSDAIKDGKRTPQSNSGQGFTEN